MLSEEHQQINLKIIPTLNEAQARLFVAKEAIMLGRGGYKFMSELTGMFRPTIRRGAKELEESEERALGERIRVPGGGRKRIEEIQPKIDKALNRIMEQTTAGDPMSTLRWTSKSTTKIAEELNKQGFKVSQRTVHNKLSELGYSLQLNTKHKEGSTPKNRVSSLERSTQQLLVFSNEAIPLFRLIRRSKKRLANSKMMGKHDVPMAIRER